MRTLTCEASRVSEPMFLAAAKALASEGTEQRLAVGAIYRPLSRMRAASARAALAFAEYAHDEGLAQLPRPVDLDEHIRAQMYDPSYDM